MTAISTRTMAVKVLAGSQRRSRHMIREILMKNEIVFEEDLAMWILPGFLGGRLALSDHALSLT